MKQRLSILAVCIVMLLGVPTLAQMPQPFSADMSTTSANSNANIKGKFFLSLPKMRLDINDTGGRQAGPFGGKMSMIMDATAKMAYMLMPEQQMYMEMPLDQSNPFLQRMPNLKNLNNDPCTVAEAGTTCKKLGVETVNGRTCDKWEATRKGGETETYWIDQKLHFPIKSQGSGGTTTEFTNIKEGPQDPELFKVPTGYHKFDASMMGQRPH